VEKPRVAFMGSPAFAVPSLEALLGAAEVVLVVTQPDKPAGRGRQLAEPPVKEVARRAGVPVRQPPSLRKPPFADELRALDLDLAVVVAYGKILPPDLLAVPRHGCWNVHASMLPRYRGAAPIQWALLRGEPETGVTLMQMDAGLDTGDMLLRRAVPIADDDTSGTLHEKLAPVGAALLLEGLERLRSGALRPEKQDEAQATLAPMLEKEAGRIEWAEPAARVRDRIRGVDPWPGAFTLLDGEPLKLWRPALWPRDPAGAPPGAVLGVADGRLLVACADGAVAIAEGQLPGRRRLGMGALVAGRPIPPGTVLG
jgi:methionyl-tRNA formyltransferase